MWSGAMGFAAVTTVPPFSGGTLTATSKRQDAAFSAALIPTPQLTGWYVMSWVALAPMAHGGTAVTYV